MRERPILFSGAMVRAILEGRKTQTRRVWKRPHDEPECINPSTHPGRLRYGKPGDRLWVRETCAIEAAVDGENPPPFRDGRPIWTRPESDVECVLPAWRQPHYRASDPAPDLCCERDRCAQCRDNGMGPHWIPSIHMPRWACRLVLEITDVRVERLQAISQADADAEGVDFLRHAPDADERLTAKQLFECLWSGINGQASWDANPWVWALNFRRVTG